MSSTLFVPCAVYSLNQDSQTGHWQQRARLKKVIRQAAKITALNAVRTENLRTWGDVPVQIIVQPHECRTKLTDAGNCMASAKAAIDGLRDAGVIIDDNPRYVKALTFLTGVRVAEKDQGLLISFREWT